MKIISGKYKGSILNGYNIKGTRPTMDRVKESVFGMIQTRVLNSVCLDLFSGSGSLGLEAISMGALKCYFVDNNKEVIKILKKNITKLKVEDFCEVYNTSYELFLSKTDVKFDLVFLDPPYNKYDLNDILIKLLECDVLKKGSLIVVEHNSDFNYPDSLNLYKQRKYGNKQITILEK